MRLAVILFTAAVLPAQQYTISTLAGAAPQSTPIVARDASIPQPLGVAADRSGNIYFVSRNTVFKVDPNGVLTRVAGNSRAGFPADGTPAADAELYYPSRLASDAAGNLYVQDRSEGIRRISPAGIITTAGTGFLVAVDAAGDLYLQDNLCTITKVSPGGIAARVGGNGSCGYSGDGGPAAAAQFGTGTGALDSSGNLYITDIGRIREIAVDGIVTTVAGTGDIRSNGDGGPATEAAIVLPSGVAVDPAGNLYFSDGYTRLRKVERASGIISTVAGIGMYVSSGDGGPAIQAGIDHPYGVAIDTAGNIIVSENSGNRIRSISTGGTISTIAGNGTEAYSGDAGAATEAQLDAPWGVATDTHGNSFVSDSGNHTIRKIAPDGTITTVAGNGTAGFSGDGGPAVLAQLHSPLAIAIDREGNLYVADSWNNRIRKVGVDGIITTIAGSGGTDGYYTYSGDGGPATAARLGNPHGVAVDSSGSVYIGDSGNNRVRKVTAGGIITTIAGTGDGRYSGDGGPAVSAEVYAPTSLALDASGDLYFADTGNNRIRKIAPNGTIVTVAGDGIPLTAPQGLALDSAGNLYVSGLPDGSVRRVSVRGAMETIAGRCRDVRCMHYAADGSPASGARLSTFGIAVDAAFNVYVADPGEYAVRLLTPGRRRPPR
jgi:sugar lactone lactonase YvrE